MVTGNNFAGPDARSQQNLAWTPDTGGLTTMAMNLLGRQQALAARKGLANQQQKALKDQIEAKQAEVFKQGPHDAGLFTGVYNSQYYKPFMQDQFSRSKSGTLNPAEFNAGYGQIGSAANFLKQEGEKFKQTLDQRAQAEPYYNWGDIRQKALATTEAELQNHLKNGGTLESFMPDYNRVVQDSVRTSNDFLGNQIGEKFLKEKLQGKTKKTVQFTDDRGNKQSLSFDAPNFTNVDRRGRITGFNYPEIVDAFMANPGGEGYLKFKAKELYDSDPVFKEKYDTFKADPVKFNKLLYEQVIRPKTGNPLLNRDVEISTTNDLAKTTDEDMEEMQAATPIPGQITIPRGGVQGVASTDPSRGKADFLAPSLSFSLTGKQFNNYKQPIKTEQYYMDGPYMRRVPFKEETYNKGLADKKVDFTSLPVLNDNMYFKGKDGQIRPINNRGELMLLTPARVDGNIKKFGEGNVFINTGTKAKPVYTPVPSGDFALSLANPNVSKSWVSYKPFAKVAFVGQAGPFPVDEGGGSMADMMRQKGKGQASSTAETERFLGEKANRPRFIPIWQSKPGFIQDIIRNVGVEKFNEMLNQLPNQTYSDFLSGRQGQPAEAQTLIP